MEPESELDAAYSGAGATATPWTDVQRVLEEAEVSWIATVRADGRPHVTPLVSVWLDGTAYFCTGPDEQKAVNLRTNAKVVLTTGCNRWDEGTDVVVEGDAVRVTDDVLLGELAAAWATKWDGSWQFQARDGAFHDDAGAGVALVFAVTPAKVLSFAKGEGAATRHRFWRSGRPAPTVRGELGSRPGPGVDGGARGARRR